MRGFCFIVILTALSWSTHAADMLAHENKLSEIKKDLAQKTSLLKSLDKEEQSIFGVLGQLDQSIKKLQKQLAQTQSLVEQNHRELQTAEVSKERAAKKLTELSRKLRRTSRSMFVAHKGAMIRALTHVESLQQRILRRYAFNKIAKTNLEQVIVHRQATIDHKEKRDQLLSAIAKGARLLSSVKQQVNLLQEVRKDRKEAIAKITKEKHLMKKAALELSLRQQKVARLLQNLQSRRAGGPGQNLQPFGLPVKGRVYRNFGQRRHSGEGIASQGMHIRAHIGTQVSAILGGTVVYVGWMRGFGRLIIIEHSPGQHSLYAHLDDFSINRGERAKAGQTIGFVGETESLDGPKLYFELRRDGQPVDPLILLGNK